MLGYVPFSFISQVTPEDCFDEILLRALQIWGADTDLPPRDGGFGAVPGFSRGRGIFENFGKNAPDGL